MALPDRALLLPSEPRRSTRRERRGGRLNARRDRRMVATGRMTAMRALCRFTIVWLTVATAFIATSGLAADQTILGSRLVLRDSSRGADPTRRIVVATGRERASPNTLVGDPTASGSGGTIALFLN